MEVVDLPVPRYKPMLASTGAIRGDEADFAFEPKMDGWRATVSVAAGRLLVRTRNGHDVTSSVPELGSLSEQFFGRSVVLDGELVAHKGTPSSFYRLSGRMAAKRPSAVDTARQRTPATFVALDVLWHDGDVTGVPYTERRQLLESFELAGPAWCTVSSFPGRRRRALRSVHGPRARGARGEAAHLHLRARRAVQALGEGEVHGMVRRPRPAPARQAVSAARRISW